MYRRKELQSKVEEVTKAEDKQAAAARQLQAMEKERAALESGCVCVFERERGRGMGGKLSCCAVVVCHPRHVQGIFLFSFAGGGRDRYDSFDVACFAP